MEGIMYFRNNLEDGRMRTVDVTCLWHLRNGTTGGRHMDTMVKMLAQYFSVVMQPNITIYRYSLESSTWRSLWSSYDRN